MAHMRQSRPDSSLGFLVKVFESFELFTLLSEAACTLPSRAAVGTLPPDSCGGVTGGYLAHKQLQPHSTLQKSYAYGPMLVQRGWVFSYERGTPARLSVNILGEFSIQEFARQHATKEKYDQIWSTFRYLIREKPPHVPTVLPTVGSMEGKPPMPLRNCLP